LEFTKLSEVAVVETANDTDKVLIEQNGEIKRVPKTEVGGSGGAGLIISTADMTTFTANMTLTEAIETINTHELTGGTVIMSMPEGTMATSMIMIGDMSAELGAECVMMMIAYPEAMPLFWTSAGISTEPPA
jgi:hypothetical protein